MKNLQALILSLAICLCFGIAVAQPIPRAASQAEVDAGIVRNAYVSPFTLDNWSGGGGPTNGGTFTGTFVGNGAGLTNVVANMRGYVTVFDFGGVDNIAVDNAAAFNRMFRYCATNGAIAQIVPATNGYWSLYDTLYCSNSVTIQGGSGAFHVSDDVANLSKSHLRFFTTNKHGIVIVNPTASVKIDRVIVSCATAFNWASNTFGIYFAGGTPDSDCSIVSQVMVTNYGVGILGASCADTAFRNCSFGYNGDGMIVSNVANSITLDANQMSYNYRRQYWNGPGAITTIVSGDFAPQASLSGSNSLAILNSGQLNILGCNIENNSTNPCIINNGRLSLGDSVTMQNFLGNFPSTYSVLMTNGGTSTLFVSRNASLNSVSSTNSLPIYERAAISGVTGTSIGMVYAFENINASGGIFQIARATIAPFFQFSTGWSGYAAAPGVVASTGLSGANFAIRRYIGGSCYDQLLVSLGREGFGGDGTSSYWVDLGAYSTEKVTTANLAALQVNSLTVSNGIASYATNIVLSANAAGYTNSATAPGTGVGKNMIANVIGTSGSIEFWNRSGTLGQTVCGLSLYTNTITTSGNNIYVPVNSGFRINTGVGVTIQVYAQ